MSAIVVARDLGRGLLDRRSTEPAATNTVELEFLETEYQSVGVFVEGGEFVTHLVRDAHAPQEKTHVQQDAQHDQPHGQRKRHPGQVRKIGNTEQEHRRFHQHRRHDDQGTVQLRDIAGEQGQDIRGAPAIDLFQGRHQNLATQGNTQAGHDAHADVGRKQRGAVTKQQSHGAKTDEPVNRLPLEGLLMNRLVDHIDHRDRGHATDDPGHQGE